MSYSRRTSEKAQSTKKRIFEAGIQLFGEKGLYATTVEEITVASGVSVGSFYYHFKSKEDLLSAAAEEPRLRKCNQHAAEIPDFHHGMLY